MSKLLVLNSGTHPEPAYLASGLIARGHDVEYWTSSSWARNSYLFTALKSIPIDRIRIEFGRRRLPEGISRQNVRHVAVTREFAFQAVRRMRPSFGDAFMKRRLHAFNSRAASLISNRDPHAVIAQQTNAIAAFRACSESTVRILNYPIAHHTWLQRAMREEAAINPAWAPYLQGHDFTAEESHLLDEEVRLADRIFVASTFVKSTFLEAGVEEDKLIVIPLGGNIEEAPLQTSMCNTERRLRVLFAGQITQRKGISYLMDAFDLAESAGIELRLVGDPVLDIVEHFNLRSKCVILPSLPRSELRQQYQWADVLVLPSLAEGFGLTALEAMSAGTPVIVSTRTFGPDIIDEGKNGLVIQPANSIALAHALSDLAANRDRLTQMAVAAQETARRFTWERYAEVAARAVEKAVS